MIREAQSILVFLIGGALLRISLTDVYLRYVKEGLRPFLIASGAALVVVAVATLAYELFGRQPAAVVPATATGDHAHAEGGHDHHHGPRVAWLLMLPVFAIFLVAPPALGSDAATRSGTTTVAEESEFPPLPKTDPVPLTLIDYSTRAVWDDTHTLADRRVELTGFLSPRPAGGMYLTRMIMTCCAADGRPIKVALSGDLSPGLKANSWVRVIGEFEKSTERDKVNNEPIPSLSIESMRPTKIPANPYE